MADTSIIYDIIARDRASKTLGAVSLKAAALGAAVGVMAVKFGKDAVSNASDLNETLNKSNVIFGKNAKAVESWADNAAQNLGLSKAAALESAAGFGNMFDQLGFTGDQATKMSKSVVTLSADLGSFNNLPTADVAEMMSAAFRGEYDSLQRLIPNINAARVEQAAMAATGKDNAKELTAQEKAAAVLAIVTKDGSAAAGDFAETSGGLANQQKILKATYEDITAEVGTALLPVLTTLAGELLEIIGFVQRNSDVIVPLAGAIGGLAATVWGINAAAKAWSSTMTAFNTVLGRTATATTDVGGKMTGTAGIIGKGGIWGLAIAAGIGVLATFAIKHQQAKARIDEMAGSLDEATGAITRETRATVVNNLEKAGALEAARKLGINLRDVTAAALGNEAAQKRVNAATREATADLPATIDRYGHLSEAQRDTVAAANKLQSAISSGSAEMEAARTKAGRLREALNGLPRNTALTVTTSFVTIGQGPLANKRVPAFAGGVRGFSGGLAMVGEAGPELVSLPVGADVYSSGATRQMMGSPSPLAGNSGPIVVSVQIDKREVARAVALPVRDELDSMNRRRGDPTLAPAR